MSPELAITQQPLSTEAFKRRLVSSHSDKSRIIETQNIGLKEAHIALNDARDCIAGVLEELIIGNEEEAVLKLRQYLRGVGL